MKNRNTEGQKIQIDNTEAKNKEKNNRKDNKNILIS